MNPKAPNIYATIKLHKEQEPIRPIVNWKNIPGYKLATHLAKLLKNTIQLPNAFNIQNSIKLMQNLQQVTVDAIKIYKTYQLLRMTVPISHKYSFTLGQSF
jgi:hypothetical protein